jgi:23S rRNA-/tRNA-specific pseudouridylate synthase
MIRKVYWALVSGDVGGNGGTWTDYLRKVPNEPRAEKVDPEHPEGRLAKLRYTLIQRREFGCWLRIETETGRMHQIRLQAGSRGYPILGDRLYGSLADFGPPSADERGRWIALHARSLRFHHPMTRQVVEVRAPLSRFWLEHGIRETDVSSDGE